MADSLQSKKAIMRERERERERFHTVVHQVLQHLDLRNCFMATPQCFIIRLVQKYMYILVLIVLEVESRICSPR